MGWTFDHVSGKIDRRAEVDNLLTWTGKSEERGEIAERVLKSAMRGSTYYGAVEHTDKNGKFVFAVVALTEVRNNDYFNFGTKIMDETMGPGQRNCPKTILDLLTETDSAFALEWRKNCRENLDRPSLAKIPIGAKIRFHAFGQEYTAYKMAPNHQFKTAWFYCDGGYMPKKHIRDFEIID